MRDVLVIAAVIVAGLSALFLFTYGARLFSNATTPITVHDVAPGVTCATMVTSDGAAIDCWKSDQTSTKH